MRNQIFTDLSSQLPDLINQNSFAVLADFRELVNKVYKSTKNGNPMLSKICLTGAFELFDYNAGFLCLKVYVYKEPSWDYWTVRWIFSNLDDGMWVAYSPSFATKQEAENLLNSLELEVIPNLNILSTSEVLNNTLRAYKMFGDFES